MTLEREVLVLQYSSGLRVLGNQHSNWTLIRYKSLEAAALYLDSTEAPIGIIDCSGVDKPDAKLECWLNSYQGVSWIAVLSKCQLSQKEWQLFVVTHCYDYHTTPISEDKLFITIGRAYGMTNLKSNLNLLFQRGEIIGKHNAFKNVLQYLHQHSGGGITLSGEKGTGRRLLAESWANFKGLHFLELSAGCIDFNDYQSRFEFILNKYSNDEVCLFISDVEHSSLDVQHQLCDLFSVKEQTFNRCEFVFCSRFNFDDLGTAGVFSPCFLMLLKNNWLSIPPLRDRGQDKLVLAEYYLHKLCREKEKRILGFSSDAEQAIAKYDWPGNVTELIERIAVGISSCEESYLRAELIGLKEKLTPEEHANLSLRKAREEAEALAIKRVLNLVSGRPGRAAELLCISRASLHRLIARYGIRR
ncbi:sigma-54-dependent Fis family transcriptional regulator [Oceanisphaera marina]|uniref:Sigma-54-dependent Fis family transcriptional regulator n=2 Tax=Oceanisphaera marina TaxID=2017550 RepID=A0ABQ1IKX1_9GAMM|nr:sigma-54-dependent Fis family transcriptional regulator [Oceanisphaera marina]